MTINNHSLYVENIWDWGILDGCFGKNAKVKMSDIDGLISHANRHFLLIETKSLGVPVPDGGQGMTFERLLSTGLFTVFVVWGKRNEPEVIQIFYENGRVDRIENATLDTLRHCVKAWWAKQEEYWSKPGAVYNHLERWRERCSQVRLR